MPPRRPQQERSRATVESILEAGFICVAQRGLAGTTTRRVADIAGIGVGSFYEYFANKDELFDAMREAFVMKVVTMLEARRPAVVRMNIEDAVNALLAGFGELLRQDDGRYLRAVREAIHVDLGRAVSPISEVLVGFVLEYVMHHPELTRIRHIPTMSYIFIHGGISSVVRHLSEPNPPMTYEELSAGVSRMVSFYVAEELRQTAPKG